MNTRDGQRLKQVTVSAQSLGAIEFFRGLSGTDREYIARYCSGALYPPRTQIVHHESENDDVFFIAAGRVQATVFSGAGRVITFQELRENDMFGELAAIDQSPRAANVVTITESLLVRLAGAEFRKLIKLYPSLNEAVLKRLTRLVRFLCERLAEQQTLPVKERIYLELLRLVKAGKETERMVVITHPPTHEEFANRVGTNRSTVTRALRELVVAGLLEKRSGGLAVKDVDRLTRLVESAIERLGED